MKIANLLCVCFGTFFGEDETPSPDADVISLTEFARGTMQTLFLQICGADFRHHPPQRYCDKAWQEPTIARVGFVFM